MRLKAFKREKPKDGLHFAPVLRFHRFTHHHNHHHQGDNHHSKSSRTELQHPPSLETPHQHLGHRSAANMIYTTPLARKQKHNLWKQRAQHKILRRGAEAMSYLEKLSTFFGIQTSPRHAPPLQICAKSSWTKLKVAGSHAQPEASARNIRSRETGGVCDTQKNPTQQNLGQKGA